MKKTILLCGVALFYSMRSNAQNNTWTKSDNENLFSECRSYISKYVNLTDEQRESLCMCYYKEINKKYDKTEYQSMLDIETKRIKETLVNQCAKNSSFELSEQKKLEPKVEPKKNEVPIINKKSVSGVWEAIEGTIWSFYENGDMEKRGNKIIFNGTSGKWFLENTSLIIMIKKIREVYKITKFDGKSTKERQKMALGAYYSMHPEKSKKKMKVLSKKNLKKTKSKLPKKKSTFKKTLKLKKKMVIKKTQTQKNKVEKPKVKPTNIRKQVPKIIIEEPHVEEKPSRKKDRKSTRLNSSHRT